MSHLLLVLILLLTFGGNPDAPTTLVPANGPADESQNQMTPEAFVASLTSYDIGILKKGPNWTAETPSKLNEAMKKKREPWRQAIVEGNLVGAVRVVDPSQTVALIFFKNQTSESMKAMAANSEAIKTGLLTAEVQRVWGTKGLGAGLAKKLREKPKAAPKREIYYMVITTKGKNWSEKADAPETRKSTSEQIQYLYGLYKAGQLKYYCTLEDFSQQIRGLGIFKTASDKEALDLMNNSPAVKSGWLSAWVKTVEIAEGVLP